LTRRKPDIRIILSERSVLNWVVVMPGNIRYFRRRPWWMASRMMYQTTLCDRGVSSLELVLVAIRTLGKWSELVKA
jgi:hypothetical protein